MTQKQLYNQRMQVINIQLNDIVESIRQTLLDKEDTTDYLIESDKYSLDELKMIRDKSRWMITNDKWRDTYSVISLMLQTKK